VPGQQLTGTAGDDTWGFVGDTAIVLVRDNVVGAAERAVEAVVDVGAAPTPTCPKKAISQQQPCDQKISYGGSASPAKNTALSGSGTCCQNLACKRCLDAYKRCLNS